MVCDNATLAAEDLDEVMSTVLADCRWQKVANHNFVCGSRALLDFGGVEPTTRELMILGTKRDFYF